MPFLGMRGTGDWVTDERPKNWRQGILMLYPNGEMPLTAIMSKMSSEKTDDAEFNWWTKALAEQTATITGVFTDVLTTPYVSGGVAGDSLYFQMSEAHSKEFRAGHIVSLRLSTDQGLATAGRVTSSVQNGANSYIIVSLLEDDDNGTGNDLSDATEVLIIGSAHEEGADRPNAVAYDPTKIYNYTQIFRTPLEITRTARKTRLRTKNSYEEAKREALELHGIEMERAFLFGIKTEGTGANGKPLRTTGGIIEFIKTYASGNIQDYRTVHSGDTWLTSGEEFIDNFLELIFRHGKSEKLGLCGSGALLGIQKLVKNNAQYNLSVKEKAYGIQVVEWVTPFGVVYLKSHPLFTYNATDRNTIVFIEPSKLKTRIIDDTMFKADKSEKESTGTGRDGLKEEFLSELGMELHHPACFGVMYGVGLDG